jgi:hypothetical protein
MGGKLYPLKVEVWDEDDKKRGGPGDDELGHAIVDWRGLFPDPDKQGKEIKRERERDGVRVGVLGALGYDASFSFHVFGYIWVYIYHVQQQQQFLTS